MKKFHSIIWAMSLIVMQACSQTPVSSPAAGTPVNKTYPDAKPDSYWKKVLTPEAYAIMVERGTESPFKNPYWDNHKKGIYVSAATGKPIFSSDTKFESGTGWPSFYQPMDPKAIKIVRDSSYGMVRDEVVESSTGLHLGHVFDDGPAPTGKRYCMNSYAFKFIPSK